jgi:hypothetical protein
MHTLNNNWLELEKLPTSSLKNIKTTYAKLNSIDRITVEEARNEKGEEDYEEHHIIVSSQGKLYLYKTEKTYEEAQQTAKELTNTIENPSSQIKTNKTQKLKSV